MNNNESNSSTIADGLINVGGGQAFSTFDTPFAYVNLVTVFLLCFVGLISNVFLMVSMSVDQQLLKKKFCWNILIQCFLNSWVLTLMVPSVILFQIYKVPDTNVAFGSLAFLSQFFCTTSFFLLIYRCYVQSRVIRLTFAGFCKSSSTNTSSNRYSTKSKAFIETIKIVLSIFFVAVLVETAFPGCYFSQQFTKAQFNYPPDQSNSWNYVLFVGNVFTFYIPCMFLIHWAVVTVKTFNQFRDIQSEPTEALLDCYRRRRQSTFVVFAMVALFMVSWAPYNIYGLVQLAERVVTTTNRMMTYFLCMSLVSLYNALSPVVIILLSDEIRRACFFFGRR